jgi:hypothetical protein
MENEDTRSLMTLLLSSIRTPPDDVLFINRIIGMIQLLAIPPPDPVLELRYRLYPFIRNLWTGRDVFTMFSQHPREFFQVTGESLETFEGMYRELRGGLVPERRHKLTPRNRLLLVLFWLKQYPTTGFLSVLFDVSQMTISREVNALWRVLWLQYRPVVRWPEREEWRRMRDEWPELPGAVGVIDGTSHKIYRPGHNIQARFYSGHRHIHCVHTQIVIDNKKQIRHISSGFLGHNNDAQSYNLMDNIGLHQELDFPSNDCFLLADQIYPSRPPLIKPYSVQQLSRKSAK